MTADYLALQELTADELNGDFHDLDAAVAAANLELDGIGSSAGFSAAAGTDTLTSATYVNPAWSSSMAFTKVSASSALLVNVHLSLAATGSANNTIGVGLRINGVDYDVYRFFLDAIGPRYPTSGSNRLTGIAAGAHTVQLRYRRVNGAGNLVTATSDWLSMTVMEAR